MKILLFGKDGQVGTALQSCLQGLGELKLYGRSQANFMYADRLAEIIHNEQPDIIINAAAYTAVDKAEEEHDIAIQVNAVSVEAIARAAQSCGAWLIHYSTDYVYDGEKTEAYTEKDSANPLSVYGASKLAGDKAIASLAERHIILRSSWVYGQQGQNFAATILQRAKVNRSLGVVSDQVGTPCSTELLARVTRSVIERVWAAPSDWKKYAGLYHVAPHGKVGWYQYAGLLIEEARRSGMVLELQSLTPITAREYNAAALRPANSCLNCCKLQETFGITLPDWSEDVIEFARYYALEKNKDGI